MFDLWNEMFLQMFDLWSKAGAFGAVPEALSASLHKSGNNAFGCRMAATMIITNTECEYLWKSETDFVEISDTIVDLLVRDLVPPHHDRSN